MSAVPYVPAKHYSKRFNCPNCNTFAQQTWFKMNGQGRESTHVFRAFHHIETSVCDYCDKAGLWFEGSLILPRTRGAPQCNADLNEGIRNDYEEAAKIEQDSPRSAAALLRLCIQKTCIQLGEKGKNINEDIESLVKKGLPVEIKQALDVVRVVGNNAVHPGEMDVSESPDVVSALFQLVNAIADRMITQPKRISELHNALPESVRKAIEKRDEKAKG